MKRPQLLQPVFLVLLLLVVILKSNRRPFRFINPLHFLERQVAPLLHFQHRPLDRRVHHSSERQRRLRFALNQPQLLEQRLLWAAPISHHTRWTQLQRLRNFRMIALRPLRNSRKNLCRSLDRKKKTFIGFFVGLHSLFAFSRSHFRRNLQDIPFLDRRVHHDVFNKQRHLTLPLRNRRQRQPILRPRQRHIKQPPLLLRVVIALRQLFLHQFQRKLEQRLAISRRKRPRIHSNHKHLRKFQPFRAMHRHQLHCISRHIVIQRNRSVGLLEIIQILQKFAKLPRFAFRFPFLHEFRQPLHVLPVLPAGALRNFQPLRHIAQNLPRRPPPHRFPLFAQKFQQRSHSRRRC